MVCVHLVHASFVPIVLPLYPKGFQLNEIIQHGLMFYCEKCNFTFTHDGPKTVPFLNV